MNGCLINIELVQNQIKYGKHFEMVWLYNRMNEDWIIRHILEECMGSKEGEDWKNVVWWNWGHPQKL